jgi:hypothetical protein
LRTVFDQMASLLASCATVVKRMAKLAASILYAVHALRGRPAGLALAAVGLATLAWLIIITSLVRVSSLQSYVTLVTALFWWF